MNIIATFEGDTALLAIEGKITVNASPELQVAVNKLPDTICNLNIDLAEVGYIASAGLRTLIAADKLMTERGGRLHLLHPTPEVMEVFVMTGLADILIIEQ